MPALSVELRELLTRTNLTVLPEDYFVVYLPVNVKLIPSEWFRPATTRFAVFIREPKVITLVVPRRKWLRMQNIFDKYEVTGPMKVISFDVKRSLVATAYMAAVGSVLTESNIGAVPMSSFKRDHILVQKSELPRTIKVLRRFMDSCRRKSAGNSTNE